MFVILVGRPATGKGEAIDPVIDMLREANTVNLLSDRLTIEYVLEKLSLGFPITTPLKAGSFIVGTESSCLLSADELSVFLRSGSDALGDLCHLWDNKSMDYGTRGKGLFSVKDPCPCMLGGSTATWLAKSIPNDAIGGGFTRRVNFVYTRNDPIQPKWGGSSALVVKDQRWLDLVDDLRYISSNLHGQLQATPAFIKVFDEYTASIKVEDFDDEVTMNFKSSKWLNAVKLAMVLSVSRGDSLILDDQDLLAAIPYMERVEQDLSLVFRAVGESEDAVAASKILEYIDKRGKATLSDIMHALWRHVTRDDAIRILSTFVEAGLLRETHQHQRVVYAPPITP